jgi:hypothetical protein
MKPLGLTGGGCSLNRTALSLIPRTGKNTGIFLEFGFSALAENLYIVLYLGHFIASSSQLSAPKNREFKSVYQGIAFPDTRLKLVN